LRDSAFAAPPRQISDVRHAGWHRFADRLRLARFGERIHPAKVREVTVHGPAMRRFRTIAAPPAHIQAAAG